MLKDIPFFLPKHRRNMIKLNSVAHKVMQTLTKGAKTTKGLTEVHSTVSSRAVDLALKTLVSEDLVTQSVEHYELTLDGYDELARLTAASLRTAPAKAINKFEGVYTGGEMLAPPDRASGLDYRKHPSIVNGVRVEYKTHGVI
jgi:hypothetical protein